MNAFESLNGLISVLGNFFTQPIFAGFSLLSIIILSSCIGYIISITLGGIESSRTYVDSFKDNFLNKKKRGG